MTNNIEYQEEDFMIELKPALLDDEPKKDKGYKSFKDYYSNPEFKAKHDEYVRKKVQCPECTKFVQRVAMAKHKKSRKHIDCCASLNDTNSKNDNLIKLIADLIESHNHKI